FLLLAGGLLLAGYLYTSLFRFSRNAETYYADAADVGGLQEGSDVEMGGYRLGAVQRIQLRHDPRLTFVLELALRRDIPLLKGTRAVATSRSLTGGRFLDLRPPAGARELLEPRSHLPVESEPALQDILNKADSSFANLTQITAELNRLVATEGNSQGLRDTFARMNRALADVDTAIHSANRLVERLDAATRQLAPSLSSSAEALAGTLHNAESAARRLDMLLEKQGPALEEFLKQGNARLAELKSLSSVLAGYDPEKNSRIRSTLEHLNVASKNLEELLADVKRHPWKLIRIGKENPLPPAPASAPAPGPSATPSPPGGG
ncbi:MAG: MlaD family protein, partial [Acidobacteriota bacterium]|nr:MlaD family protein [Acidobacteriota bacterium]